jgi:hypothetical protein
MKNDEWGAEEERGISGGEGFAPPPIVSGFCKHSLNFLLIVFYFVYIYVIIISNPHGDLHGNPSG